jgi:hypothetical protein
MANIDLTPIIEALVMLIAGLITYKLLPWIKARATTEQLEAIETATTILVFAAEQSRMNNTVVDLEEYVKSLNV